MAFSPYGIIKQEGDTHHRWRNFAVHFVLDCYVRWQFWSDFCFQRRNKNFTPFRPITIDQFCEILIGLRPSFTVRFRHIGYYVDFVFAQKNKTRGEKGTNRSHLHAHSILNTSGYPLGCLGAIWHHFRTYSGRHNFFHRYVQLTNGWTYHVVRDLLFPTSHCSSISKGPLVSNSPVRLRCHTEVP